jgi:hypothetical protein
MFFNSSDILSDTKQFVAHESKAVGSTMPPMHALLTNMFSFRSCAFDTQAMTVSVSASFAPFVFSTPSGNPT